jgi:hypothetical protein
MLKLINSLLKKDPKGSSGTIIMDIKKDELTGFTAGTYSNLEVNYKKDNLNILEALQYLFKGKKIKHKKSNKIYQILDNQFSMYSPNDSFKEVFDLCYINRNIFYISFNELNNWQLYSSYVPISFSGMGAKKFFDAGYTITRISTGKSYNKADVINNYFSMEDIDANDWIIEEKELKII